MRKIALSMIISLSSLSCSSPAKPPENMNNICKIFEQYPDWYKDAKKVREEWGAPIPLTMAFVKQESAFVHDAKAPKRYFLGFIPRGRKSSSLGYSQALEGTWKDFEKATNKSWDRIEFDDSLHFIGWYTSLSRKKLGIPYSDVYGHYQAYHDGHAGFQKRASTRKDREAQKALSQIARNVSKQASTYRSQLQACEAEFNKKRGWWFW